VDVVANAGGYNKPWDTTFPVSVSNGQIAIAFTEIHNPPIINAIQVTTPGVHVTPATSSLNANQTQQFVATVDFAANSGVTWSINPPNAGSISASGLYTAPTSLSTPQTVTVTATSQAATSIAGTAIVTLMPLNTVTISPATASIYGGQTQQFTATYPGGGTSGFTWTVSPATGAGTVSSSGLYTAPASVAVALTVPAQELAQRIGGEGDRPHNAIVPPMLTSTRRTIS